MSEQPTIDVFSDASQRGTRYTGAYMIGDEGPFGLVLKACLRSIEAELRTAAYALWEARSKHPEAKLVVHTDLNPIVPVLVRNRVYGASELAHALEVCEAEILMDANDHQQHHQCHLMARRWAKIGDHNRPEKLRPATHQNIQRVIEVLVAHEQVTQMRLSQEAGLPLNVVHKALRYLETQKAAVCERTDGPMGCDLRWVLWSKGERFAEVVGSLPIRGTHRYQSRHESPVKP